MDFASLPGSDEEDEVELVFDDADLAAFMPAAAIAPPPIVLAPDPAPDAEAKPAKKRPAKGKAPPEPEPAVAPAPAAALTAAIAPADAAPAIVVAPAPRLVMLAVALAAFASVVSGVGVVVTARNIATLSQAKSEAAERQALLARLPALVDSIEHLRDAQRVELGRLAAIARATPVTLPDLRRELDNTRLALGKSQPAGIGPLGGVVRAGQTELVQRMQELSEDVRALGHKAKPAER